MEYKIVVTGTMGAGKTTAIRQISETPPVLTDVTNTIKTECDKPTTTAAFDYGEVGLGEGEVLRIYGTPGQERFRFMWPVLARGALGIVYLVDCSRPEPLADLGSFFDGFGQHIHDTPSVVVLNRVPNDDPLVVEAFQEYIQYRGLPWPAVCADLRRKASVLDVFELLLSLSETDVMESA